MLVLVTTDVVLRYFFNAPLQWGRDANGLLLLITLFSAFPRCWDRGQHIRMEVFYARQRASLRIAADVVSALTGIVVFAVLACGALYFARYMFVTEETAEELMIPLWPFMLWVGVCAFVLALRLIANPTGRESTESSRNVPWN